MWFLILCLLLISLRWTFAIEQPLIFNPYTHEIYNIRGMSYSELSDSNIFATACPATESNYERELNDAYSYGHKSLLMRKLYHRYQKAQESGCQEDFKLSILSVEPQSRYVEAEYGIELGYEVYFERSENPNNYKISKYHGFGKISEVSETPVSIWTNMEKLVIKMQSPAMTVKKSDQEMVQNMGFIWLPQIQMLYNAHIWNVIRIHYKLHRNADQLQAQVNCSNYDLGNELYRNEQWDDFYELAKQRNIFDNVILPQSTLADGDCNRKHVCLKKYNLVPPYVFQSSSKTIISCTDLTSIPIWYEVSGPLLDYLDKFLVSIAQITEKRLEITSGVLQTLQLPSTENSNLKDIYLHAEKSKLPVPKIIFKVVKYTAINCNTNTETCAFETAIVIHNEPDFDDQDKLCQDDKCQIWGWDSIQYQSTTNKNDSEKSRHIYCCKVDGMFIQKIQWNTHETILPGLDLTNFPQFDKNTDSNFTNKQEEFENIMEQLFPPNGSVDWNSIPNLPFVEGNSES